MIKSRSLKNQLFVTFGGLILIVCLFFTHFSFLIIDIVEENTAQAILIDEASYLSEYFETTQTLPSPRVEHIRYYPHLSSLPERVRTQLKPGYSVSAITHESTQLLVKLLQLNKDTHLYIVLDRTPLTTVSYMSSVMPIFLFSISVGVFILAILSSWYLATMIAQPILRLTKSVVEQNSKDPEHIPGKEREDEIGHLAVAFSNTFDELQNTLTREQNFTRDVSHELRTPITLIKNTLELSKDSKVDAEGFLILEQASNELKQTIEVLLALARKENLHFESQAILPLIEKAVLSIYQIHPHIGFQVNIKIPPLMAVTGNQYLISLLCQNLVNNGFYHGYRGSMRIVSEQNKIVFENELSHSEDRPYYQGLGHGQYLVKRIANVMGWRLSIEQQNKLYRVTLLTQ